jgi:hypothetical protein
MHGRKRKILALRSRDAIWTHVPAWCVNTPLGRDAARCLSESAAAGATKPGGHSVNWRLEREVLGGGAVVQKKVQTQSLRRNGAVSQSCAEHSHTSRQRFVLLFVRSQGCLIAKLRQIISTFRTCGRRREDGAVKCCRQVNEHGLITVRALTRDRSTPTPGRGVHNFRFRRSFLC